MKNEMPVTVAIKKVIDEATGIKSIILPYKLDAKPGQFAMAWLPGVDEKPFSLAGVNPIAVTVAEVGPFTEAVHKLKEGDRLWVRGPFGTGFSVEASPALLVAGGYGSAPLSFLARELRSLGQDVYVALGANTADALLLRHRFEGLGCTVHLATEDGSAGRAGLVTDLAATLLARVEIGAIYACGPNTMLNALAPLAQERNLPCQLSHEAYMRCGIGVCGSCTCGDRLVCRDGPVFKV